MEIPKATCFPRAGKVCCVPNCYSYKENTKSPLFTFPEDEKLRKVWKFVVGTKKEINRNMFVCSKHFVDSDYISSTVSSLRTRLKKDAVPTRDLPVNNTKYRRIPKFSKKDVKNINSDTETASSIYSDGEFYNSFYDQGTGPNVKAGDSQTKFQFANSLDTDDKLYSFTGIHHSLLNHYVELVEDTVDCKEMYCENVRLGLVLVFTKLRTNLSYISLSVLFGWEVNVVKDMFSKFISLLYSSVEPFIYWPTKYEVSCNRPKLFEKFKNIRVILGVVEFDLRNSKTLKFLIGVTPSGLVSYISKGFYSSKTIKSLMLEKDLINSLQPHDAILTEEKILMGNHCKEKSIKLIDFSNWNENNDEGVTERDFFEAVFVVGQIVEKFKTFNVINGDFKENFITYTKQIMTVIAAIINMSSPIVGEFL